MSTQNLTDAQIDDIYNALTGDDAPFMRRLAQAALNVQAEITGDMLGDLDEDEDVYISVAAIADKAVAYTQDNLNDFGRYMEQEIRAAQLRCRRKVTIKLNFG